MEGKYLFKKHKEMAKKETGSYGAKVKKTKVRRKGVHAKTKASYAKTSKNYLKRYSGQGK